MLYIYGSGQLIFMNYETIDNSFAQTIQRKRFHKLHIYNKKIEFHSSLLIDGCIRALNAFCEMSKFQYMCTWTYQPSLPKIRDIIWLKLLFGRPILLQNSISSFIISKLRVDYIEGNSTESSHFIGLCGNFYKIKWNEWIIISFEKWQIQQNYHSLVQIIVYSSMNKKKTFLQ